MSHKKHKTPKRNTWTGIADFVAMGLVGVTLLGFLGSFNWILDLFAHFRVQYMQLCLPLIGIYLWKRMNHKAIAVVLLAALNYSLVLPFYFGKPAPAKEKPIRAMLLNLNAGNGNTDRVLAAIREYNPDILLLEEVTPHWATELRTLDADYAYKVAEPQDGCFGIMLLSKHPLKNGKMVEIGTASVPSITATVYLPRGEIQFFGTHPLPPIGRDYAAHRNNQLSELAIHAKGSHVLLMGDLNTSPWSPHFKTLLENSGLENSMKGFGFQPTWPAGNPFMKIPLDHVLHSEEIIIHNRVVGGDVGSDHYPVVVDFSIR